MGGAQGAKGSLVDPITTKGYGTLDVSGVATLAGSAKLKGTPAPKSGSTFPFISDGGTTGTFATVTGLFTLSYTSSGVTATAT